MATAIAALKGKLGSTEYFITAMKAKELARKAIIPTAISGWDNATVEERERRDIDYAAVKNEIAPYLAEDKDRFFGSIILAAINFNPNNFESMADKTPKDAPIAYQTQAKLMGFLILTGGEVFIPLDGQHRLKAVQYAIEGKDERGKATGLPPSPALADEDITVIVIPYSPEKSRKIFTKVNRRAKPAGKKLITDNGDFIAVSSRNVANKLIGADLVKYKSNALTAGDPHFTTLAAIALCNGAILEESFPQFNKARAATDAAQRDLYAAKIESVWKHLLENIDEFIFMKPDDKGKFGNRMRREIREDFLLGKPAPQFCLFKAFARLVNSGGFTYKEASDQLNKIDWRTTAEIWDNLLVANGKILTKNAKVAADIIYYICGGKCDGEKLQKLQAEYQKLFPPGDNPKLPPKV